MKPVPRIRYKGLYGNRLETFEIEFRVIPVRVVLENDVLRSGHGESVSEDKD